MWQLFVCLSKVIVTSLILHFDGSLRLPSNYRSEEIRPHHLLSSQKSIASCAAALIDEDGQTILSLGGQPIPITPKLTSADVEYEGLLLGLNHLLYLSEHELLTTLCFGEKDYNKGSLKIVVRGDCKVVFDHMNQVATPRKQRAYYNKAKSTMEQMQSVELAAGRGAPFFHFEHVPREKNVLCDLLCRMMISALQSKAVEDVRREICDTEEKILSSDGEFWKENELPSSKKKRYLFFKTPFNKALGYLLEENDGRVPLHARVPLICDIACAAIHVNDVVAMRLCGKSIIEEAKQLRRFFRNNGWINSSDLEHVGWDLEYAALVRMNLHQQAKKYANQMEKNRFGEENQKLDIDSLLLQVVNEIRKIRFSVKSRYDDIVVPRETILPHSEWNRITNDWHQVLTTYFVEQKEDFFSDNCRKIIIIQPNIVWSLRM